MKQMYLWPSCIFVLFFVISYFVLSDVRQTPTYHYSLDICVDMSEIMVPRRIMPEGRDS